MALIDIREQYRGRWKSIHAHIGISLKVLNGKHQPCPFCGGTDRFRYANQSGSGNYYCNQCGNGNGIELVMTWLNLTYKQATLEVRHIHGDVIKKERVMEESNDKNKQRLAQIHKGLHVIRPGSIQALYLAKRGITVLPEQNCHAHAGIDYWSQDENGKTISLGKFPAIVSSFRDEDNNLASYHIIYIGKDGEKPDLEVQKKILPPVIPITGTAIKLFKHTSVLCVAEGIESGLCAYFDSGFPVWVAGNANNMAKMKIPEGIKSVYIYEDADFSFAGRVASSMLANRLAIQYPDMIIKIIALINREHVVVSQDRYDINDYVILHQAA